MSTPAFSPLPATPAILSGWPQVPDCHGWLSLDRRGHWRLQGEVVRHPGLLAYLGAHYGGDGAGHWWVQNGPQRVYVSIAAAPWVLALTGHGGLRTHTGLPVAALQAGWLDEQGQVWLDCEHGLGLLDDRDLARFVAGCTAADGLPLTDAALEVAWADAQRAPVAVAAAAAPAAAVLHWQGLPIACLPAAELRQRALHAGPLKPVADGTTADPPEAG